ncbi:MAG TPA: condensation domain-containing protein [Steroidobacteraceae bacterium]|nr:condensation domain-containing protein [Steroidobacteraceae bacterium]
MLPTQRALLKTRNALVEPHALSLLFGFLLEGPLDQSALRLTFQDLVRRHEPLRACYLDSATFSDTQLQNEGEFGFRSAPISHTQVWSILREWARLAFNAPPLLRAMCVNLAPDEHLLLLAFDHLAIDGWGLELLAAEAEQLYAAHLARRTPCLAALPAGQLALLDSEITAWSGGTQAQMEVRRRRAELQGIALRSVHPFGDAHELPSKLRRRVLNIPTNALERWRASSRAAGLTLFPALLAATAVTLCKLRDLDEVVIGGLVANRHTSLAQRTLGAQYSETIFRISCPPGTSVKAAREQAAQQQMASLVHRIDTCMVARLLADGARASRPILPSCMVIMDRHPLNRLVFEDLTVTPLSTILSSAEDLSRDQDIAVPPTADLVLFLRQFEQAAGLTVFWNPQRIPDIAELLRILEQNLGEFGGALASPMEALAITGGLTPCAWNESGWTAAAPTADALSPPPWFAE